MDYQRYTMPFSVGGELSTESFMLAQTDETYRLASPRYQSFYSNFIRPRIQMYNGWIQGFHSTEHGVLPSLFLQRIGNGIVNTLFGKPIVLNTEDAQTSDMIASRAFRRSRFSPSIKDAYAFAIAGGTGLIKLNRDGGGELRFEAVPMDRFFVETDAYGDIERVRCFITAYHDTISSEQEYYLCEERFFKYASDGKRYPFVHYTFYKTSSNITHENTQGAEPIPWKEIPYDVRKLIEHDYGGVDVDDGDSDSLSQRYDIAHDDDVYEKCTMLPFADDLGCRLIKFTRNIPSFPKMPFGQPIGDILMNESYAYDQLKYFERVEVYLARGRVMIDEQQADPNDPDSRKNAFDPMVFTFYDNTMSDSKDGKPMGIQLELRADQIKTMKQNILNDTAFALNLSSSTIAAWLSDGTTQKTATEIEYERTKTDSFINEHIDIIREPLQELVDIYFHAHGLTSPELNIMPESQVSRSDNIRLYSELYDKGQVTAKALAEKILGTCSAKEVNELARYIESQRRQQPQSEPYNQSRDPPQGGFFNAGNKITNPQEDIWK